MPDAPTARMGARRARRDDLPRPPELLADDVLGKQREAPGSEDPEHAGAFETIDRRRAEARRFQERLGFTDPHVG